MEFELLPDEPSSLITLSTPPFASRREILQLFFTVCPKGRHSCIYNLPGGGYDLWFPNLMKAESVKENHGWSNLLYVDSGDLIECNVDKSRHTYRPAPPDRIVFAHVAGVGYIFIGIFRPQNNDDYKTEGYKYRRVADEVCPNDFILQGDCHDNTNNL